MNCFDFKKNFRSCWWLCVAGVALLLAVLLIFSVFSEQINCFFANNHHLFDGLGKLFGIFTPLAVGFVGFAQYKLAKEKEESLKYKIESDDKKLIRENYQLFSEACGEIFRNGKASNNEILILAKVERQASIELPDDIEQGVKKFYDLALKNRALSMNIETLRTKADSENDYQRNVDQYIENEKEMHRIFGEVKKIYSSYLKLK